MNPNYLNELKSACQDLNKLSDIEAIRVGETVWLAGQPAPAPKGTITLETGNNQTVVIDEKDVIEVEKSGNLFLVKVKAGTEILHRIETVTQVKPGNKCNCSSEKEGDNHDTVYKRPGAGPLTTCTLTCTTTFIYVDYVDKDGHWRQVCIPVLSCDYYCTGTAI